MDTHSLPCSLHGTEERHGDAQEKKAVRAIRHKTAAHILCYDIARTLHSLGRCTATPASFLCLTSRRLPGDYLSSFEFTGSRVTWGCRSLQAKQSGSDQAKPPWLARVGPQIAPQGLKLALTPPRPECHAWLSCSLLNWLTSARTELNVFFVADPEKTKMAVTKIA